MTIVATHPSPSPLSIQVAGRYERVRRQELISNTESYGADVLTYLVRPTSARKIS